MSSTSIGVIVIGLGPIGQRVAADIVARPGFDLVGALDINPNLQDTSISKLVSGAPPELRVYSELNSIAHLSDASVAIVCTSSKLQVIEPTILACLDAGLHVVSSCEELLYPWNRSPDLSAKIDAAAKHAKRSVLGTGINPGFLMDYLPSVLTGLCKSFDTIEVERIQDATPRRLPFQLKIGSGLTAEEFEGRVAERSIGHMGLLESVELLGQALGLELDEVTETIEPVLSDEAFDVGTISVAAGGVRGVKQVGIGYVAGQPKLTLRFIAALGQTDPRERIVITGEPSFEMVIPGGVHGDIATSAVLLNVLSPLMASKPGLQTMTTIPATTWR